MDIEAMAQAMFEALHARYNRVRDWARHNNQDVGHEFGREAFRAMARAVLNMPAPVEEAPAEAPADAPASEAPADGNN